MNRDREEELLEEIAQLKALLTVNWYPPVEWRLTQSEQNVFRALLSREVCSFEHLDRVARIYSINAHDNDLVKQIMYRLRKKTTKYGFVYRSIHAIGYALEDREKWVKELNVKQR